MMKFTKRFSAILCAMMLLLCAGTTAFAESTYKLIDEADLFSADEETELTQKLEEVSYETGWDVVAYTNYNGVEPRDMKEFCRDYYNSNNFGVGTQASGVMLNIDMSSRSMFVFTYGETMDYFSDDRLDEVLDEVQYNLSEDDYYSAVVSFALATSDYYHNGIDTSDSFDNLYESDADSMSFSQRFFYVLKSYGIIIAIFAIAVGALSVVFTKKRYKNHGKSGTYDLKANSSTTLYEKEDIFLHKSVSVTTVSSSSSGSRSGGGGSRSGGGGGGRSF